MDDTIILHHGLAGELQAEADPAVHTLCLTPALSQYLRATAIERSSLSSAMSLPSSGSA